MLSDISTSVRYWRLACGSFSQPVPEINIAKLRETDLGDRSSTPAKPRNVFMYLEMETKLQKAAALVCYVFIIDSKRKSRGLFNTASETLGLQRPRPQGRCETPQGESMNPWLRR